MLRTTFTLLGLMMLASPLSAQSNPPPSDPPQSFESLMEDGLGLREAGRDAEALVRFEKCLELAPASGQAIGQIAFAEMALGRLVLAEAHLIAALRHADDPWVGRHRAALEEAQLSMSAQVATVEIPVEGAEVTFTESGQTGTRATPVTLRFSPGRHELRVTAPGFEPTLATLNIEAGQRLTYLPPRHPSVVTTISEPVVSANPSETSSLLTESAASTRYRVRSNRLDVSAAVFAVGAIATGVVALVNRPQVDILGVRGARSMTNQILVGTAIASAGMALVLFIAARVVGAKHRRENSVPSF
ncbi:MAG: hypothetical protein ACI9KE_004811 [Polyangiales bacterium]|jgi:hypothetical protein